MTRAVALALALSLALLGSVGGCALLHRVPGALEHAAEEGARAAGEHAAASVSEALESGDFTGYDWSAAGTGAGVTGALVAVLAFARFLFSGAKRFDGDDDDEG